MEGEFVPELSVLLALKFIQDCRKLPEIGLRTLDSPPLDSMEEDLTEREESLANFCTWDLVFSRDSEDSESGTLGEDATCTSSVPPSVLLLAPELGLAEEASWSITSQEAFCGRMREKGR